MADLNDNLMGSTASVSVDQAAMDLLTARQAESEQMQAQAMPDPAPESAPFGWNSLPHPLAPAQIDNVELFGPPVDPTRTAMPPLTSATLMQAEQQSQQFANLRSQSRRGFDAEAANARAAARPYLVSETPDTYSTLTAPADAGSRFDHAAFEAERLANSTPPRSGGVSPISYIPVDPFGDMGQGRADGTTINPNFSSPSIQAAAEADQMASPARSVPRYASYEEFSQAKQDVLSDARNQYAASGRGADIGGADFNREVSEANISLGLENPPETHPRGLAGAVSRLKEDWNSPWGKLNFAFAGATLLQGAGKDWAANNSGAYLTPEQQETESAGLLPGAGALLGTAIGAATPIGGWGGGILGGGIGQFAQSVVGANEQREGAAREAGERLAASLGAAADTASRFKDIIEATGASTQTLGQGLAALSASGPGVGAQAIAGAGRSALSEGEFYAADTAATSKFLSSDPALAPLAQTYRTQGELSRSQFQSIASLALGEGDTAEFNTAMLQSSRATLNTDAQYQGAAQRLEADKSNWVFAGRHWFNNLAINKWANDTFGDPGDPENISGVHEGDYIEGAQKQMDDRKKALDAQNSTDARKYVSEFADINKSKQDIFDAGMQSKIGEAGFSLARLQGASASTLRGLLPGLNASTDAATAADQLIIDTDTKMMAGLAPDDPTRTGFQNLINSARADMVQNPVIEAERARTVFSAGLDETQSAFSLQALTSKLSGASSASVAAATARQVSFLTGTAADPQNPLSPTERDAIQSQAAQLAYTQAQGIYADENGALSLIRAGRDADTSRAQTFGSPMDVFSARMSGLQSDRDQIAQNNSELARGNLTFSQRQDLQRQNIGLQSDLIRLPEQARVEAYNAEGGILSDTQGQSRAGFSRDVRLRGSAAYADQIAGDDALIRLYGAAEEGSPVGSSHRARFGRQRADTAADRDDMAENAQVYRELPDERTQDILVAGEYRRALKSPFLDGTESNPLTAGNALLSNLQNRERGAEKALRESTDPLARERNTEIVESYKDQISDFERDRLYNGLLPQDIQRRIGMPGGGVGVAVTPLAALAASMGDYNPTQGGFGAHPSGYHSSLGMAPEGGAAGSWAMHAGIGNVGGGTDAATKTAANTDRTNQLLTELIRHLSITTNRPPAPMGQVGSYARSLNPAGF